MTNYSYTNISKTLFLDIESVREYPTFEEFLKHKNFDNWKRVAAKYYADALKDGEDLTDEQIYYNKSALHGEYAKVVCVGLGKAAINLSETPIISAKYNDFTSHNEAYILNMLAKQLEKLYLEEPGTYICGHNIIEYDIPFLIKRMIKHKIKIPQIFVNFLNAKPWDVKIIDTMKDWKMNTSKIVSLDVICEFLGIPTSKDGEVNGKSLGNHYWSNQNIWTPNDRTADPVLASIAEYCKKDVRNVVEICAYLATV